MKKTSLIIAAVALLIMVIGGVAYYSPDWLQASTFRAGKSVTKKECVKIKRWFDQGTLTRMHKSSLPQAALCAEKYADMWYGRGEAGARLLPPSQQPPEVPVPDAKRCKKLRKLYDQGKLSKKELDRVQANICSGIFREIWFAR